MDLDVDMEVQIAVEDNLMDVTPSYSDQAPGNDNFAVPEVPQISQMELNSGESSKKRTRSKDPEDPDKRIRLNGDCPLDSDEHHIEGDMVQAEPPFIVETREDETLNELAESVGSETSVSDGSLLLTDAEETVNVSSDFFTRGSLTEKRNEGKNASSYRNA